MTVSVNVNTQNTVQQAISQQTPVQENDVKINEVINKITLLLQKLMNQLSEKNAQQIALVFVQYIKFHNLQGQSNKDIKDVEQKKAVVGGILGVSFGLATAFLCGRLGSREAAFMAPSLTDKAMSSIANYSTASLECHGKDFAKLATLTQNATGNFTNDERKMLEDYNAVCGLITSLYNTAADLNGRLNQVLHVQ